MQICTSLQTDNHASTPPLSFLQAGCSSCRPTNSVKALLQRHGNVNEYFAAFLMLLMVEMLGRYVDSVRYRLELSLLFRGPSTGRERAAE